MLISLEYGTCIPDDWDELLRLGMPCHEETDRRRDQMGGSEQVFFFLGGRGPPLLY